MALYTLQCESCRESFEASRPHAETCSGRCRARLSRERREARHAAAIERAAATLASLRVLKEARP
ncbi:hypothetical protein GCM10027273_14070 [Nocardioides pakistanensis]